MKTTPRRHTVLRLTPDLLLVFKPRGHREEDHVHPRRQRLRVLSGALEVQTARRSRTLRSGERPLTLAVGEVHSTRALAPTWLIAEWLPAAVAA